MGTAWAKEVKGSRFSEKPRPSARATQTAWSNPWAEERAEARERRWRRRCQPASSRKSRS